MPLESCPTCGYALSVLDHHCRHCPSSRSASAKAGAASVKAFLDVKHMSTMIIAVLLLSGLAYLMFFR